MNLTCFLSNILVPQLQRSPLRAQLLAPRLQTEQELQLPPLRLKPRQGQHLILEIAMPILQCVGPTTHAQVSYTFELCLDVQIKGSHRKHIISNFCFPPQMDFAALNGGTAGRQKHTVAVGNLNLLALHRILLVSLTFSLPPI